MTFTPEEEEQVIELAKKGRPYTDIAKMMGKLAGAVRSFARDKKLTDMHYPKLNNTRDDLLNIGTAPDENCFKDAVKLLRKRYKERNGFMFLDGMPCNLNDVMRAANQHLANIDEEQLGKNPAWLYPKPEQISVHSKNPWHENKMPKDGNPRVFELVLATGMNVSDFLNAYGIPREGFYRIAKLGSNPKNPDGEWRVNTIRLAKALRMKPEEIFPEESSCTEQ